MYYNLIDGISCREFGLTIPSRVIIPFSQKDIELKEIEARDGSLTYDRKRRKDRTVSINFQTIDFNNMNEKARNIQSWLEGKELKFSDDFDIFYKIKKVDIGNLERTLRYHGKFTVDFTIDPYNYFDSGKEIIEISSAINLYNPGYFISKPFIKITGEGTINLTINGRTTIITSVANYININSDLEQAYRDIGQNQNYKLNNYPYLDKGLNKISFTGSVSKIELTPNWR